MSRSSRSTACSSSPTGSIPRPVPCSALPARRGPRTCRPCTGKGMASSPTRSSPSPSWTSSGSWAGSTTRSRARRRSGPSSSPTSRAPRRFSRRWGNLPTWPCSPSTTRSSGRRSWPRGGARSSTPATGSWPRSTTWPTRWRARSRSSRASRPGHPGDARRSFGFGSGSRPANPSITMTTCSGRRSISRAGSARRPSQGTSWPRMSSATWAPRRGSRSIGAAICS